MTEKSIIAFEGENLKITKEQYDTFVTSISSQKPTKAEIELHLWYCDSKNVNPLDKLIYFTKRSGRYTPITSIDFMRLRAESSNAYAGNDDAEFFYEGTENGGKDRKVHSAKVTVYKMIGNTRCPFSATARWSEYAPLNLNDNSAFMWKKMPHTMLAKCAEALALRKAFPGQLHGLYASEEMAQDGRYINEVDTQVIEGTVQKAIEVTPEAGMKSVDEEFPAGDLVEEAKELGGEEKFTKADLRKEVNYKAIVEATGWSEKDVIVAVGRMSGKRHSINEVVEFIKNENKEK